MKQLQAFMHPRADFKLSALQKELKAILTPHETVEKAYLLAQNIFVFTDKRLIIGDPVGFAEAQFPCHTIPYRSITHFSLIPLPDLTAGMELSIWLQGDSQPLLIPLDESPAMPELHCSLADYVLNKHSPWLNKHLMWKKDPKFTIIRAVGITGAALLTATYFKRKRRNEKASLTDAISSSALKALVLKKLKG